MCVRNVVNKLSTSGEHVLSLVKAVRMTEVSEEEAAAGIACVKDPAPCRQGCLGNSLLCQSTKHGAVLRLSDSHCS